MTRPQKNILSTVAIIGLLLPALAGALISITADVTLRTGTAGTFVYSSTSGGGFFTPAATSVQTSSGTVVVSGPLSALRGQQLGVEDRLKSGLWLCVKSNSVATTSTCAPVLGPWTGEMQANLGKRPLFAWLAAHVATTWLGYWFVVGFLLTFIVGGATMDTPAEPHHE